MYMGLGKDYMDHLRDPMDSEEVRVRLEEAYVCYGEECGRTVSDGEGNLELLRPHCHLMVTGINPRACERAYAIGGELPSDD
jgi:hypothetical protein